MLPSLAITSTPLIPSKKQKFLPSAHKTPRPAYWQNLTTRPLTEVEQRDAGIKFVGHYARLVTYWTASSIGYATNNFVSLFYFSPGFISQFAITKKIIEHGNEIEKTNLNELCQKKLKLFVTLRIMKCTSHGKSRYSSTGWVRVGRGKWTLEVLVSLEGVCCCHSLHNINKWPSQHLLQLLEVWLLL